MSNTEDKIYVPMTQEEYLEWIKAKENKEAELKALEWNDDNVIKYICDKFYDQLNQHYNYKENINYYDRYYDLEMKDSEGTREVTISHCSVKTNEWVK